MKGFRLISRVFLTLCLLILCIGSGGVAAQTITVIDEFSTIDPNTPFLTDPTSWTVNLGEDRGEPSNVLDSETIIEQNLDNVVGRERKTIVTSAPRLFNGILFNRDVEATLQTSIAVIDGQAVDGALGLSSSFGGRGSLSLLYDQNGSGLNLNLSTASLLTLTYKTDHVGEGEPTTFSLTLVDADGNIHTESFVFSIPTSMTGIQDLDFDLTKYVGVDLTRIYSIQLDYEADIANDILFIRLSVDTAPYSISGKVTFKGTTLPVPGVSVSCGGAGSASSIADGTYIIGGLGNVTCTLSASKTNYTIVPANFKNPVTVAGTNLTDRNFIAECADGFAFDGTDCVRAYRIGGTVTLQETGLPVPGVWISGTPGLRTKITSSTGEYLFTNVLNGDYTVALWSKGYNVVSKTFSNPVTVNGADELQKDFVLTCAPGYQVRGSKCERTYSLSGTVTLKNSSLPVIGATITGSNGLGNVLSGNVGEYSFNNVFSGSYNLSAAKPGYVVVSTTVTNPVKVFNKSIANLNFIMDCDHGFARRNGECVRVYSISGSVTLEGSNAPVIGISVSGTNGLGNVTTGTTGGYLFPAVTNGDYSLNISSPAYVVTRKFTNPVTVSGSNVTQRDFVLSCATGFVFKNGQCVAIYQISGAVTLGEVNGPRIPDVTIGGTGGLGTLQTNSQGSYVFTNVTNGSYALAASKTNFVVVSQSFTNPVSVNGANVANRNFVLKCADEFTFQNGTCVRIPESITVQASDGTFSDFVLVTWTPSTRVDSYELFRSDIPGQQGTLIGSGISGTQFQDTTADPDARYHYTVVVNDPVSSTSNQDEGWRPGASDRCEDGKECINEKLEPTACASANGFLEQINVATVISRSVTPLDITVEYRDLFGEVKGTAGTTLQPNQKMDFIVNELGLELDTYGTICVAAKTDELGAWMGGVTLYKADTRDGDLPFGTRFDFVLHYPFTNPRTGTFTQPLNTFHLGVQKEATIANWIRLTDAEQGDGERLRGELVYYDANGEVITVDIVDLPDGGRFDYAGHERIGGDNNIDAVGMVRFIPAEKSDGSAQKYYLSLGRYFYDCVGAGCTNFYTAFVVPYRPASTVAMQGGVSTVNGELSIVELNNITEDMALVELTSYNGTGTEEAGAMSEVPARATRHQVINKNGDTGFLNGESVGSATVRAVSGAVSAVTFFYKLDESGRLRYAYAAPLVGTGDIVQLSEFNTFIGNKNVAELHNTAETEINVQLVARNVANEVVLVEDITLEPHATERIALALPENTFGTLIIQSDIEGLVFRNYVSREEYTLSFRGQ